MARSIRRALFAQRRRASSSRSAMAAASISRAGGGKPGYRLYRLRGLLGRHRQAARSNRPSEDLDNVRLFTDDALKLLVKLPDAVARRRLSALSRPLAEIAPPQAPLHLADDAGRTGARAQARHDLPLRHRHRGLCELDAGPYRALARFPLRRWCPGIWHEPYPGWQPTRYEDKARLEGRSLSFYFQFLRAFAPSPQPN